MEPMFRLVRAGLVVLRTCVVNSRSETRCEYVPVSSGPASLRGTVSEREFTTQILDRGM